MATVGHVDIVVPMKSFFISMVAAFVHKGFRKEKGTEGKKSQHKQDDPCHGRRHLERWMKVGGKLSAQPEPYKQPPPEKQQE